MSPRPVSSAPPTLSDEAGQLEWLTELAWRRTGNVAAGEVAAHVLRITPEGDSTVRRAALDAIARRFASRHREKIVARWVSGAVELRAEERGKLGYRCEVSSGTPLVASCDCADYLCNSLGFCKHVAALLQTPGVLARSQRSAGEARLRLRWDPVRPLTGAGDWLERLSLDARGGERDGNAQVEAQLTRLLRARAALRKPEGRNRLVLALSAALAKGRLSAEPAVAPLLERERQALSRQAAGAALARKANGFLKTLRRKPYRYQIEGITRFLARGRLLLADDMGLGKTMQAIGAAHVLWHAGTIKRGLVVVPASLKAQWRREWELFTDVPIAVLEGNPAERAQVLARTKQGVLLANYEQVVRDLEALIAWRPELVVLDEAQRIKNWATKTALSVKRLVPEYRLVLTGTPFENRIEELASLMEWVDDTALEPKWRLAPWHTVPSADGRRAGGARHLDTLRLRLANGMLRRNKRDVLAQLPARTDVRVPVELTPEQRAEHDERTAPIAQLVARAAKRPLTQGEFLRLMQLLTSQRMICNGLSLLRYDELAAGLVAQAPSDALLATLASPKLGELRELVQNLVVTQERKVVVFSQWRRMLELARWAASDLLALSGLRAVFFTGSESQEQRGRNVDAFHEDPATRIFFATDAGGVGLNLQAAAATVVNLELPWNPAVLEQRIGRIHRHGQKQPIEVYNLVCEEGIEARIAQLVADKRAVFSGLFDGTTDEVRPDGASSFLARVEKLIEPANASAAQALPASPAPLPEEELAEDWAPPLTGPAADPDAPGREPEAPVVAAPAAATPVALATLFGQVTIRPSGEGRVSIDAPKEVATQLAAMLAGMARMFEEAGR